MTIFYFILFSLCYSQDIYTEYLISSGDTIDIFSYQIPENYNSDNEHPLLVAFHQWGGNESSNYYTNFDEEANNRNWIMLSPYGGSSNNYNHQGSQNMVQGAIEWIIDHFNIDSNRIYMIGGSMGGASGAIYHNNHLNPLNPMVAATASASGILDCERRAIEMDGNNSMIEWFGGNWDEVPFEYHRNSAVYFADSIHSMHYNLQYTPLYLDFGVTEPHRTHAEEFYEILTGYNENIWIDTDPTGSHGYSVFDENHVCNWLDQFELISQPININVNLDEPSRAYWAEAYNQIEDNNFIRLECSRCSDNGYCIENLNNSDTLIFHILDAYIPPSIQLYNEDSSRITVGVTGDSPLIPTISNIGFESLNSSFNWENLNQTDDIIYVDISSGSYSMSFEIDTDINQDGESNVLDVVNLVNLILN